MFRIFNMLVQNLSNMGNHINDIQFNDKYISIDFTDAEGNVYSGFIRKEEKKEETENA